MKRRLVVVMLALFVSLPYGYAADSETKPPWRWTPDERISARFNPESMRARRDRARHKVRIGAPDAYLIEGQHDPALFFTWEVFDGFLQSIDVAPSRRSQVREHYRGQIESRGWNFDTFWREVDSATTVYMTTRKQQADFRLRLAQSRKRQGVAVRGGISDDFVNEVCYERAKAMGALRRIFGGESFDEFLYASVAPNMTLWITADRDSELLKKIEGGCQ